MNPDEYYRQIRELVTRRGGRWEPACTVCGSQRWAGPELVDGVAFAPRINGPDELIAVGRYLVLLCDVCANTLTFDVDHVDHLLAELAEAEGKR